MLRIRIDPDRFQPDELAPAVAALREGGVVAMPTDTLYGLAADPRSTSAVEKIFLLKGRPQDRPVPLVAASLDQVREGVGTLSPLADRLAASAWPGPLTLIIEASAAISPHVHLRTGKVGVRVPDHAVTRALAFAAGHALTSTSANLSGGTAAGDADEVAAVFDGLIDVLVDAGKTPGGPPSTIVDATGGEPILVRAGAFPWERVLKFLR